MVNKRNAYPVVLDPAAEGGYIVTVPDFEIHTHGDDLADALYMAQDAIEMMVDYLEGEDSPIPAPSDIHTITTINGELKTYVLIDLDEHRRKIESRIILKSVTIPSWLNIRAEEEGINFSKTLQDALKAKLGVEA